jgi:hypothetical protein
MLCVFLLQETMTITQSPRRERQRQRRKAANPSRAGWMVIGGIPYYRNICIPPAAHCSDIDPLPRRALVTVINYCCQRINAQWKNISVLFAGSRNSVSHSQDRSSSSTNVTMGTRFKGTRDENTHLGKLRGNLKSQNLKMKSARK